MSLDQMKDPNTNIVLDHGTKKYTIFQKETAKNQRHNNNVKSHWQNTRYYHNNPYVRDIPY